MFVKLELYTTDELMSCSGCETYPYSDRHVVRVFFFCFVQALGVIARLSCCAVLCCARGSTHILVHSTAEDVAVYYLYSPLRSLTKKHGLE